MDARTPFFNVVSLLLFCPEPVLANHRFPHNEINAFPKKGVSHQPLATIDSGIVTVRVVFAKLTAATARPGIVPPALGSSSSRAQTWTLSAPFASSPRISPAHAQNDTDLFFHIIRPQLCLSQACLG